MLGSNSAATSRQTVTLTASDLERALGGPMVTFLHAAIEEFDSSGNPLKDTKGNPIATNSETYANETLYGVVLPPQPFPVPALQLAPVLRFGQILEIEKTVHHIVRNTTLYSKAVWVSLTTDERAILLDGYTIGVPSGGISDESQMVPLLNCIQNKLLGFFGNSMIMPFMIPQAVAEQMGLDPAQMQETLLAYQKQTFVSPRSTIALPTRGVLGEAVLGHCSSAEKIDITRFWNWQDSPADTAPTISPVTLPTTTPSIAGGLTAPNSLTNLPPLINNILQAPTPNTSLLQALGQAALGQPDFSTSLTGAAQLAALGQNAQNTANAARADALNTTRTLTAQAMATIGNLVGGAGTGAAAPAGAEAKGAASGSSPAGTPAKTPDGTAAKPAADPHPTNPNAGSNAASAVLGTRQVAADAAGAANKTPATGGSATPGTGGGGGGTGNSNPININITNAGPPAPAAPSANPAPAAPANPPAPAPAAPATPAPAPAAPGTGTEPGAGGAPQ